MSAVASATQPSSEIEQRPASLSTYTRNYAARVRGGDMGSLPAVLGLIVLCLGFGIARPVFFSTINFANLFTQAAAITAIAMGLVFVLLLGEIDLSAGFASGVCAAVLAVLLTKHHAPWYVAILAALVTGVVIGVLIGFLVTKVGIPSFVVTLAGFLAFQGVLLLLVESGKNIPVTDPAIMAINATGKLPPAVGWALLVVAVAGFTAAQLVRRRNRAGRGLAADPLSVVAVRVGTLAVIGGAAVYVLNLERSINPIAASVRGVPVIVLILGLIAVLWTFVLNRTAYGRHVYAVGGNREAARRAGINVDRIRISVFVIGSTMAAVGGIIAASRANSVDPNTGGSTVLLYAVGAAVIGGTSLFGGKGRIVDAVLGGAVMAVIENGMGLMGVDAGIKYAFTGGVLLLAAGVDALSRRRAAAAGLR
ncbi:ABC transporter permease [Planosporangium flavigriseum]|uniref:Xylose transport system permease protein XylH n=1 Tax=Planosporangium flavigriseum TaxID=373681 RepID=A0A8J3LQC8_9ACTN|nr:ABC transporter permease [Planosporangium flavigriseum]NJC65192.1 ABC transporter permease [Planosporangium flavigriseum]GIG71811.1 ABC transporter permease [Planosporangium flavigriseum]